MKADSMVVTNDEVSKVVILHVTGELTLGGNIRLFREKVSDLLEAGCDKILVDVANVTHIDGSGIGELLIAHETVSIAGGEIKLLNLGKRPRDIPHAMILSTVFETFEDASAAILSYSSSKPFDTALVERTETSSEFCWVNGWPRLIGPRG